MPVRWCAGVSCPALSGLVPGASRRLLITEFLSPIALMPQFSRRTGANEGCGNACPGALCPAALSQATSHRARKSGGQRGPEGEIPADIPAGISTPVAALRRASPVRPRWQVAGVHAPNARLIHDVRRRRGFAGPPHGGLRGANRRDGADRPARRPTLIAPGPSSSRPPRPLQPCNWTPGYAPYRCSERCS